MSRFVRITALPSAGMVTPRFPARDFDEDDGDDDDGGATQPLLSPNPNPRTTTTQSTLFAAAPPSNTEYTWDRPLEPGDTIIIDAGQVEVRMVGQLGRKDTQDIWRAAYRLLDTSRGTSTGEGLLKLPHFDRERGRIVYTPEAYARAFSQYILLSACASYPRIVDMLAVSMPTRYVPFSAAVHDVPIFLLELADMDLQNWVQTRTKLSWTPANSDYPASFVDELASLGIGPNEMHSPSAMRSLRTLLLETASDRSLTGILSNDLSMCRYVASECARALIQLRIAYANHMSRTAPIVPPPGSTVQYALVYRNLNFGHFLVHRGRIILGDLDNVVGYRLVVDANGVQTSCTPLATADVTPDLYTDPLLLQASKCTMVPLGAQRPNDCSNLTLPGYKADEYAIGAMLYAMAIDGLASVERASGGAIYRRALALREHQVTNAPELLDAIIGLTDPDIVRRWTLDTFLDAPLLNPLKRTDEGANSTVESPLTQRVLLTQSRGALEAARTIAPFDLTPPSMQRAIAYDTSVPALYSWGAPTVRETERWNAPRILIQGPTCPAP